ncbi:GGDEF domain-containing protein [Ferrovibrio terrae]|uniref:GGDEF domain-containing protein n=1 Tax=Ferrovibrio terrae TaxID=2594003 RepID=UPI0031383F97
MMPANDSPLPTWTLATPGETGAPTSAGFASLVLRLRLALRRDPDPIKRNLVEQILTAAAESEQQLIDQAGRIAELEALSTTDELTGLPNRRAFESFMANDLARARRDGHGGTLAFLDLDRFKAINDRYGHAAGDAVLCQIALRLRPIARATDCLARLHGDEFVLAMPGATRDQAETRLTELAVRIERQPLRFGDSLIPVGISYGLAGYDGQADLQGLLREGDRAMYIRKQDRRGS